MARNSKKPERYIGFENVNEVWVPLNWNGIIVSRYKVSNYGRLFDLLLNDFVGCSLDKDDYYMASVRIDEILPEYPYKKIRLHRFILMSFDFRPDFKNLIVNHKDGNKFNIQLSNLEWSTPIENTRHGWDYGLNCNIGLNNGNGKYDVNTISKICSLLDEGLTAAEICNKFSIIDKTERMRFSAIVSGIKYGKIHRDISCDYNFRKGMARTIRYPLEYAHEVCKVLSDGNNHTYSEVMDILNIPEIDRANFKIYINDLIRGRTAKSVTCNYNLKKPID